MSTPIMLAIVVAAAGVVVVPVSAAAAELLPPAVAHVRHHYGAACCGPCGCLHVSYVYHRELRSTYGLSFDPRDFDQTEPLPFRTGASLSAILGQRRTGGVTEGVRLAVQFAHRLRYDCLSHKATLVASSLC